MFKRFTSSNIVMVACVIAFAGLLSMPAIAEDKEKKDLPTKLALISISGSLADALPQQNPFGPSPMYFKKQLELIRKAASDDSVKAIELEVDSPRIGLSKVYELLCVLKEFKESGKKIFGYTESLGQKDLMLLSCCDYLAIPESGIVMLQGISAEIMYYKKLFEKLGIEFLVEHIGDYKSAYENYSLESMSDANRMVLENLLDNMYFNIISTIADNRNINQVQVVQAIDCGLLTPKKALEYELVDAVCYRDQFDDYVKSTMKAKKIEVDKKFGKKDKDLDMDNPFVLFSQIMSAFNESSKKESDKPKIAVIYASGMIMSGKNQADPFSGEVTIGSETLAGAIDKAADDETVKAIVLRVDSPGGSGLASDIIWRAEKRAKKKKPFIVSMSDVAASGGYYISTCADVILAQPNTLTGSIGVVSAIPNISKTLDKMGIKVERITRGKNALMMSVTAPPKDVNIHALAKYMEEFYWDFIAKVAEGRNMTCEEVHKVAQGRVWTGKEALANGLVDALGGLDDAIEIAKIKAGFKEDTEWELKEMPKAPDFFDSLSESFGVRAAMTQVLKTAGLNPFEAMILDRPELKAQLDQLRNLLSICKDESLLLVMPVAFRLDF